jgi:polysaccharide export outer membrane protein
MSGCVSKTHQLFGKHTKSYISEDFNITYPYQIRPFDRLSILVYGYPQLSTVSAEDQRGVQVASNGTVLLPLLGRLKVAGYSKEVLEDKLYRLYGEYLEKRPAVKVEIFNQKVYVLGEVKNPGPIDLMTVQALTPIKAISERGGLSNFAKRDKVLVIRGTPKRYKVALLDLTDTAAFGKNNFILQPGDILYVAHNKSKDFSLPLNGLEPSFSLINAIFNSVAMYKMVN